MILVIDTSALIAVVTSEPERSALVRATRGADLVAPSSVHWEVGNALSAALRRRRATLEQLLRAVEAYESIPLRMVDVDLASALEIAAEHSLYAYDAYVIACARAQRAPLVTFDRALARAAAAAGIALVEVPS